MTERDLHHDDPHRLTVAVALVEYDFDVVATATALHLSEQAVRVVARNLRRALELRSEHTPAPRRHARAALVVLEVLALINVVACLVALPEDVHPILVICTFAGAVLGALIITIGRADMPAVQGRRKRPFR